ncbi:hypothetical protein TIFTF001_016791 [Ficus carica]|uniref:Uncharacterized protein n=1 Tax=Ficus carica TaxID=3494 RepID=A0AA88DIX0_FICCA|nr:hypothetical protein TIFTF001_016791 [Ficus carica]
MSLTKIVEPVIGGNSLVILALFNDLSTVTQGLILIFAIEKLCSRHLDFACDDTVVCVLTATAIGVSWERMVKCIFGNF